MTLQPFIESEKPVQHLTFHNWEIVNRNFISKAICEFVHELLITPSLAQQEGKWKTYMLTSDDGHSKYTFHARPLALDHLYIQKTSLCKFQNGERAPLEALTFILDFSESLSISEDMLPTYMEEVASTLYGAAYMRENATYSSSELLQASHTEIERSMTAGHPCFVANNGRIGFDTSDYKAYAPETGTTVRLLWLAGHKQRATFTAIGGLSYEKLIAQELDSATRTHFEQRLSAKGLNASDYFLIPVHPWQWYNKLATVFAPDIAGNLLVCLGEGPDEHLAQQSIRTFYNISHPQKHYTKVSLSILNMGFMRGLSPYYMQSTPAITEWITELLGKDNYLNSLGFSMLNDVATIGYKNTYFEPLGKTNSYNKMLSALWRESPLVIAHPDQQTMTMAALLHVDSNDTALLPLVIEASGLGVSEWLKHYLNAYFKPLLHCFYHYDMVFMPHGENLILVMENHVPVKAIMKDITEEVAILSEDVRLPEDVQRVYAPTADEVKVLCIFTDMFDCFFRFMSHILVEHAGVGEDVFWKQVAICIHEYQEDHPELSEKFTTYDLFAPEFTRSCLNRLQLKNNQQMVDLSDPNGCLQFVGKLQNPVAAFKEVTSEPLLEV